MSTKALIQKVRAEVEAHEQRGWLKGYEHGLAKREQQIVEAQAALEAKNQKIRELSRQKKGPRTAREALALAWELAHEVKPGQVIPKGTRYLEITRSGLRERTASGDRKITPELATFRTLDPLPEPEPDWLDAPAVLAESYECSNRSVWTPEAGTDRQTWECSCCNTSNAWNSLRNVTPLWHKETDE